MSKKADICLILEGTYPYVAGGVSTWTHELIRRQSHLTFHIVSILPPEGEVKQKFELPDNVVGLTNIRLQKLPISITKASKNMYGMEAPLNAITVGDAKLSDFNNVIKELDGFAWSSW